MKLNSISAFSTFEFLVVAALLLIISSQGVLVLRSLKDAGVMRNTAYQIESLIEHQINRSLLMEQSVDMKVTSNALYLCNMTLDASIQCSTLLYKLPPSVSIISSSFRQAPSRANILSLFPDGSASPGTIRIQGQYRRTCDIVQSLRGRSRVEC